MKTNFNSESKKEPKRPTDLELAHSWSLERVRVIHTKAQTRATGVHRSRKQKGNRKMVTLAAQFTEKNKSITTFGRI